MDQYYTVKVIEDKTGKVVQEHKKLTERKAIKLCSGLDINLNHCEYTVILEEPEDLGV